MIEVVHLESSAALFYDYPGQLSPQPCYVELDLRDGTLRADYNKAEISNATPFAVYHGHVRRYTIPCLKAQTANRLLDELVPLAERVAAGCISQWNGRNHVAELSEDARAAEAQIVATIEFYGGEPCGTVQYADAVDWLNDVREEIRARLKAGETVEALETEYDGEGSSEDSPILVGLRHYLEFLAETEL